MKKNLSAGDVLDARCTRCRVVTNHTIIAMVEDKVVRVQCNTCNGVHNYYAPVEKRPARTAVQKEAGAPKRARVGRQSAAQAEWEELSRSVDPGAAIRYEMGRGYRVDDLVQHPVFGLGIVKTTTRPNKMEVLFEGGVKLLRCTL